jgi:predicted metallopeptidase
MAEYTEISQDILKLTEDLIAEFHPQLKDCNIGLVFRKEAGSSGGKTVYSKCTKVPEKVKPHLAQELDVIIEIAEDKWGGLGSKQRQALIDHELCHIVLAESGWSSTPAHDIEEFRCIIERYGLWNYDLYGSRDVLDKAIQLEFSIAASKGKVVAVEAEKLEGAEVG